MKFPFLGSIMLISLFFSSILGDVALETLINNQLLMFI